MKSKDNIQLALLNALQLIETIKDPYLLVAVSGGRDSIALLHALKNLDKFKLAVAHYNHGLRPESEMEERFVKDFCKSINVDYYVEKAPSFNGKENLEAWARENRYEFLERVRIKLNADFILTAHHRNDLAETILMRILSGRASLSLGGIKKIDYITKVFRPMLDIYRTDIENYIEYNNLKYVEDSSNSNLEFTRNKLRSEIIPMLEQKINPGLVESLCILADRINTDEESIWDLVNRIYLEQEDTKKSEFYFKQPKYIRWRLLKLELEKQLGTRKVGYYSLNRLSDAMETQDGNIKTIELGWGVKCEFSRKGVLKFFSILGG